MCRYIAMDTSWWTSSIDGYLSFIHEWMCRYEHCSHPKKAAKPLPKEAAKQHADNVFKFVECTPLACVKRGQKGGVTSPPTTVKHTSSLPRLQAYCLLSLPELVPAKTAKLNLSSLKLLENVHVGINLLSLLHSAALTKMFPAVSCCNCV